MVDYLKVSDRKKILDEIVNSEENKRRKEESLARYEIYHSRLYPFLLEKITRELGAKAAQNSRIISSINLTEKIVNEQARIYLKKPDRFFTNCSDDQEMQALKLYDYGKANIKFKKLNRIYKLNQQAAIQIVPKDGRIEFRALYPHNYDVVPKYDDPEKAECYIVSSFDKSRLMNNLPRKGNSPTWQGQNYFSDAINEKIGDPDDYKTSQIFYWWTDEYNFKTDSNGNVLDENNKPYSSYQESDILNPLEEMPFIDVAMDKDFEFFVRPGSNVVDFSLDLATILSDTAEISRMQGFAQAVLVSKEEPKDLKIGPRNYLWLRVDPNDDTGNSKPDFSFVSPNPDLSSSLQLISNYASMFLTSIGQSPKLVNTQGEEEKFSSGIDRFLAMLEKFEQSEDDIDLFNYVEKKAYDLVKKWNNLYANATENGFIKELSGQQLPEDSELQIKFNGPQLTMSEQERVNVYQSKIELGLMSRVEAIAQDRQIPIEEAMKVASEINAQDLLNGMDLEEPKDNQGNGQAQ